MAQQPASLRQALAAAALDASGWKRSSLLCHADPRLAKGLACTKIGTSLHQKCVMMQHYLKFLEKTHRLLFCPHAS